MGFQAECKMGFNTRIMYIHRKKVLFALHVRERLRNNVVLIWSHISRNFMKGYCELLVHFFVNFTHPKKDWEKRLLSPKMRRPQRMYCGHFSNVTPFSIRV